MPRNEARSAPSPKLAKFSRPRLFNVHKRERLFRLLDQRRAHPFLWIAGPPGSGKSTLVASYTEARKLAGIWFQVDSGDADPGTFFHYLRIAAAELPGKRAKDAAALPGFGPEYASDLAGFTRRFLRAFFALFPPGAMLVVDNFHEAPADPAWRLAFAEGIRELPAGMNMVFLSRLPPPAEMARLVGEQAITQIDWSALRFTAEEAAAITASAKLDPQLVDAIHRASDGWAAGIVLMREHLARAAPEPDITLLPEGKDAVFAYFTGEIFGRARPENQRVLMLAALLPSVSASDAEAVSGNPEAPLVLDYVYRRHLFTDRRRTDTEPVYQFHALFREFLLAEGRRRLPSEERREALNRAGSRLVARGDVDAAAALYREAQAWEALFALTLQCAAALIADGRGNTLSEWIGALPDALRAREPRLSLYLGVAVLYTDPARAKALLDTAFAGFVANGDLRRLLMTAAHAIDCHYFEWADFAPLDRWIAVLEQYLTDTPPFTAAYDGLRVYSAFLIALLFRQPEHPRIAAVAAEVERRIFDESALTVPCNHRLNAASILFNYYNWKTKGATSAALIEHVAPWLADPHLTPLNRVWWCTHLAFHHQICGEYGKARQVTAKTEAIALEHRLNFILFEVYHADVVAAASTQDAAAAMAALAKLRAVLNPARRMEHAYFRMQEAAVLTLVRRDREAVAAAAAAVAIARETGLPSVQIPHFIVREALCHLRIGEAATALARYAEAIGLADGIDRRNFEFQEALVRAHLLRCGGDEAAAVMRLRAVLPECRAAGYFGFMRQTPEICGPLFALALEHGIEPQFIREIILQRRLPPPAEHLSAWPWPLKIRTLGAFALLRDDLPLPSTGKAQKKPLELLKAVVAHGGRAVDAALLTSLLWPDAEGDDAKTSFDSSLYRLRKLLAVDNALLLMEGKLSLNPAVVWVDTWAFEAALDADPPQTAAALNLYGGGFLALDGAPVWALPLRDRLHARLGRAVLLEGAVREERMDWAGARAVYEKMLEQDNLAEAVYRRLMVCQREMGDPAAALTTYRRCRELLSVVLGRSPAPDTEAIRRTLI